MNIGLDIMGGDYAPEEAIKGAALYLEEAAQEVRAQEVRVQEVRVQEVRAQEVHLLLIGQPEQAAPYLHWLKPFEGRYTLVPAAQVIEMHEHPTRALKEKPDSSIAIGFGALGRQKADAFISAGNTGAMMVGAMYSVKTIEGILRPTIASPIPRTDGGFNLLLDVGINADCKPEHLLQFASLGSLYVQRVYGVDNPRIGLLNIGEEEGKGNLLSQAAYPLLKEDTGINFTGNVEGRDVFLDKCDVIVCEGFVGNVMLKMAESIHQIFHQERKLTDPFLDNFNYEIYGGTPILGVNAPVIIGHGISSALAFKNMIRVAAKIVASELIPAFRQHFAKASVS